MRRLLSDDENHVHTVLWDVDGVLADITHRLHLCPGRPGATNTAWDVYHERYLDDPPILGNVQLAKLLHAGGYNNVLVTNRPEQERRRLEWWLGEQGVPYHQIFMREDGANHGSKEWVLERLHLPTVVLAIDDDARHGEMYTRNGIPFLYVHSGYYEEVTDEIYYSSHYVPHGGTVAPQEPVDLLSLDLPDRKYIYKPDPTVSVLIPTSGSVWTGVATHDAKAGETVEVRIP